MFIIRSFIQRLRHGLLIWKHYKLIPWFERNKDARFFKYFENASWFKWYGRKIVHVKAKDPSTLTPTEAAVKEAIGQRDYKKALDIINQMPHTAKTVALRSIIESKIK